MIAIVQSRDNSLHPAALLVEELHPTPDPWDVAQRLAACPHLLFLDSALSHATLGRYSFITADPAEWITSRGNCVDVDRQSLRIADPFAVLAERLAQFGIEPHPDLPPFQGGFAGLFGYDLCHHIERLPRPRLDEFRTPDLAVGLYDWVIAFDHHLDRAWIISTGLPETNRSRRLQRARARLRQVKQFMQARRASPQWSPGVALTPAMGHPVSGFDSLSTSFKRGDYMTAVQRAVEYVHAGDCFQVNLAQRLLYPQRAHPLELYGRLRHRNPAPFACYFDFGEFAIASASPERFL